MIGQNERILVILCQHSRSSSNLLTFVAGSPCMKSWSCSTFRRCQGPSHWGHVQEQWMTSQLGMEAPSRQKGVRTWEFCVLVRRQAYFDIDYLKVHCFTCGVKTIERSILKKPIHIFLRKMTPSDYMWPVPLSIRGKHWSEVFAPVHSPTPQVSGVKRPPGLWKRLSSARYVVALNVGLSHCNDFHGKTCFDFF